MNNLILQRVIEYQDLFPEEDSVPDIYDLLKKTNRNFLIKSIANISNQLISAPFYNENWKYGDKQIDFVHFLISESNIAFAFDLIHRYEAFIQKEKSSLKTVHYLATRPVAILYLLRLVLSLPPSKNQIVKEDEIRLAKALLLINKIVNTVTYNEKLNGDSLALRVAQLLVAYSFPFEGIENSNYSDIFRRQLLRAVELFDFISYQKRLKPIREKFRQYYKIGRLVDYFMPHIAALHSLESNNNFIPMAKCNKLAKIARKIIKQLAIKYNEIVDLSENKDFCIFRSKPFIEVKKNCFMAINDSFISEHIYESLYFQFKKYRAYAGFKDDDEFRRYITTDFTQNWMLNRFIKKCLSNDVDVALSESDCEKINCGDGNIPPDYYIRIGNNVLLFELKSTLASAKTKDTKNYDEFVSSLKEKFFENRKQKRKAIRQLMDNVEKIQNSEFVFDPISPSVTIYPIILVDSPYYTMRGIHTILETWMRNYCREKNIDSTLVKPLILMDVSTLGLYWKLFRNKGFLILFEEYYKDIQINNNSNLNDIVNSTTSFTEYMTYQVFEFESIIDKIMLRLKRNRL